MRLLIEEKGTLIKDGGLITILGSIKHELNDFVEALKVISDLESSQGKVNVIDSLALA